MFLRSLDHQQRRFTTAELDIGNCSDLHAGIEYRAADQITYIKRVLLERCAFRERNLDLTSGKRVRLTDGIHSLELQDQLVFMEPVVFQLHFAARAARMTSPARHRGAA